MGSVDCRVAGDFGGNPKMKALTRNLSKFERELVQNFYGENGVWKICQNCGFQVKLCPDVQHQCPLCFARMVIDNDKESRQIKILEAIQKCRKLI